MQKFVIPKKYTYPERQEMIPAKVKMSGYLKKKRIKVGGWRKMWFVLQNQLLLSYTSKDDYEKKLVSFKDVLNIVPGTIIRPFGASRFTIETTTNIIYTFRCDDNKMCTEWIASLIESLKLQGKCAKEIGVKFPPKFHISLDNIRQMNPKRPVQSSCSWDSICHARKSAKLPIASKTARMLERNGLSVFDLNRIHEQYQRQQNEQIERAPRNFRLHEENHLPVNQSDEVSRINQMFIRCGATNNGQHIIGGNNNNRNHNKYCGNFFNNNNYIKMDNQCDRKKMIYNSDNNIHGNVMVCMRDHHKRGQNEINCCKRSCSRDLNQNRMMDDSNASSLQEQMQRLTVGIDKSGPNSVSSTGTPKEFKESSSTVKTPITTTTSSPSSSTASTLAQSAYADIEISLPSTSFETTEINHHPTRLSASTDNVSKMVEPIYAVVDLQNKYARRARIREMEEQLQRERPKSIHVVTSDYEEVLNFSHEFLDKDEDENENIYEPINIPEGIHHLHHHHHNHRHAMWRYFPRINIEALIELTRNKKKESPKLDQNQSPFSDIRKKLGNHRKSIKTKMRKFCHRDNSNQDIIVMPKERNAISDDDLDSQGATGGSTSGTSDNSTKSSCGHIDKPSASFVFNEIEKYRRGEKQFFGSLSRLKKGRTSLCLDDDSNVDVTTKKKSNLVIQRSACFQQELRREVTRRSGGKKVACHSKFYD